jgi:hypothetical protein
LGDPVSKNQKNVFIYDYICGMGRCSQYGYPTQWWGVILLGGFMET